MSVGPSHHAGTHRSGAAARSGVPNRTDRIGCSINDRIADEQARTSRRAFLRHVDRVLDEARHKRLIDRRAADRIERAAERSGIGS